ncbi:DUF3303 domain-containing protein [Cyanobium sp. FGCU-52]|nr:DUF3303 domain-containing protein [Cyanobium sp. FGCU52]
MKFMITWQMKPGRLHEALELFSAIPAEVLTQEPGPAIRLIGRWHDLVRGKGVVICESDDAAAVSQWCLTWNTMLDFEIGIVHDDAETQAIGRARRQAG